MKKTITTIAMGILMLAGVMGMYSGESMTFEINLTNPVYTILGNSSNIEGLIVEFVNGNITITSDPLMASDNFTLVFFDEVTKEVIKTVYTGGGGGGTRTEYIKENVTVYKPVYFNKTITEIEEVEVEKIVEKIVKDDTGYELWMVFLAMIIGAGFIWTITRKPKEESAEEIVEGVVE